ncbi:endonuclease/exonuclease/phosphatase family protein [Adhaeribacter soli]|uniref:Endonuclease n=1 Tax=Adhaeribacter soli TaxID=2607655 RepID=A0A5N1J4L3_9BACT|nr:endonuclease/exonuclease/phosphatase family protein [Adhaeribacter soli]KAA9345846.1 endonuclease [Adhaeribacter soli]
MSEFAHYLFLSLSLLTIVATAVPLAPYGFWWIRIFDFPRLQIIALGMVCLSGYIYFNGEHSTFHLMLESTLVACILYQSWRIFPYTVFSRYVVLRAEKNEEANQISIVVTNVLMTNRNYAACLNMLRKADPDVILAVETDEQWQANLKELESDYPYTVFKPLNNTYGMLLYSRLKLIDPKILFLLEDDVPSVHTGIELKSGVQVAFHGLHPKPPAPQEAKSSVPRDAELILVGFDIKKKPGPTIVAGDLNDVAWSHTSKLFRLNSGLLDPRIGRGLYSTFNSKYPILRWPLDHVFHTRDFRLVSLKRLEHIDSDHFPICIKLSYEPEIKNEQEKPTATVAEKEEAIEKLEKADEMKQNGEI